MTLELDAAVKKLITAASDITVLPFKTIEEAREARCAEIIHASEYIFCIERLSHQKRPWVIIARSRQHLHAPLVTSADIGLDIPHPCEHGSRQSNGSYH